MSVILVAASNHQWLSMHALVDSGVALADVRLHVGGPFSWYLRAVRKSAITIGNHIWFTNVEKRDDIALLAHELVHVAQYRELGIPRFLARYGWEMMRAGFRYSRRLPLEAPAYARQAQAKLVLAEQGPPGMPRVGI